MPNSKQVHEALTNLSIATLIVLLFWATWPLNPLALVCRLQDLEDRVKVLEARPRR